MSRADWMEEFVGAITITDLDGKILYLNQKAAEVFAADGGSGLVGQNIFNCHRPESAAKIREILKTGKPNVYTIEKNGQKKIIFQSCWTAGGEKMGLIELSLEIPPEMPHFVRD